VFEESRWLEDTPKGVVWNWVFSRKRFEDTWTGRESIRYPDKSALMKQFLTVTASTLAVSVTDDEFGTIEMVGVRPGFPGLARGDDYCQTVKQRA
jgi:hypothetical protein